jgi:hypothetical protein
MMNAGERKVPPVLVWWVIWLALLTNVPIMYLFLGSGVSASQVEGPIAYLRVLPFALSCIVRWLILPQIRSSKTAFPVFVIGLALAESSCFFGIFLFPDNKTDMLTMALVGLAQFAPVFARKLER